MNFKDSSVMEYQNLKHHLFSLNKGIKHIRFNGYATTVRFKRTIVPTLTRNEFIQ